MTRTLTTAVTNLLDDDLVNSFIAVKIPFPSGAMRVWTGLGDITVDSETYSGVGSFMSINPIIESSQIEATGLTISLSGVPSNMLGSLLTDEFQGITCVVHMGFLGDSNAVTGTIKVYQGIADNCDIAETGTTAVVSFNIESRLISLDDKINRRYTNEDQQIDHSSDTSLRFISGLQEKEISWGRG